MSIQAWTKQLLKKGTTKDFRKFYAVKAHLFWQNFDVYSVKYVVNKRVQAVVVGQIATVSRLFKLCAISLCEHVILKICCYSCSDKRQILLIYINYILKLFIEVIFGADIGITIFIKIGIALDFWKIIENGKN